MLRGKVTLLFMMLGMLLAIPAIAYADNLVDTLDGNATSDPSASQTISAGDSTSTGFTNDYWIVATGGCDVLVASDSVTSTFSWPSTGAGSLPAGVTASTNSITFDECKAGSDNNAQSVKFTSNQVGTYTIPGPTKSGGTGTYNTNPSSFTLVVNDNCPDGDLSGDLQDGTCAAPVTNHTPTVSTAAQDASGDEGSELTTSGAFSDEDDDALTIEQQSGAGTVTPGDNGAWSWSHTPNDNSSNNTVVVRATDPDGEFVEDTFTWSAANVAPTATKSFDSSVAEGSSINLALTSPSDPSSADTTAGFTYAFRCAGGYSAFGPSSSATCSTNDDGALAVGAKIKDKDDGVTEYTDTVIVNNVPPTITNITASAQNVLAGKDVTFTGTATDPSSVDTTAGFFWQWAVDGGALGTFGTQGNSQFKHSFSDCGSHSVSAKAKDKDDGLSDLFTKSNVVNVYSAHYLAPLNEGMYNSVQAGRVVPVKISVGCSGNLTGLQPSIQMLKGEQDGGENTTGSDNVETLSVSSADQSGVMRTIDGGYIYNLQVPSTAKANDLYTIRVNPFGGSNASSNMYIVLKIRK